MALIPILSQEDRSPDDLADLSKALSGHRMFAAVGLSGRPRVDIASPEMRAGFIERVKQTYKDRFEVNQAWRKRLASYDEIDIWPDYDRGPYQHDWQMYLRDAVTAKIEKNSEALRGSLSRTPLMTVLDGDVLVPGETRRGLDRETLLSSAQITGLLTSESLADPVFGMAYPDQTLLYALRRSMAPRAPLVVVHRLEFAGMEERDLSRDMRAFVWESAIEGVAALALDLRPAADDPKLPSTAEFQLLDGLITAAEEVNRLAGIVDAFSRDPARVAILWSESSRILDGGEDHIASVRRAYEGSSFAGHKVRFLTESQLAHGELEGIDVLILPETLALRQDAFDALQALLESGMPVIRSTFIIPYDSRGRAQTDVISFGPATGLVRGNDASTEYMEAMDEALSRNRLREVPRVTNGYGYPVEGVKTRYVEYGGERFLYLINLRKEAVTCRLTGGLAGGWDLIGGSDVEFPRSVRPIEPMLIRLDRPDSFGAEGHL